MTGTTQVAAVLNDTDTAIVNGLEEHEDRTLSVLRTALQHKDNDRDRPMLEAYMNRFQQTHDRMRDIQRSL